MATEPLQPNLEPPSWLKTLPLAPEYHPTLTEFLDPIAYILKIEKEASQYGICKIVPPLPPPPKNLTLANLTRSFASLAGSSGSDPKRSVPTFATRNQQVGLCPRRPYPVKRAVWQSGERYTLPQFEDKARQFERAQLRRIGSHKKSLLPLETETLFWSSCADKPFTVEYANDMPGSGFEKRVETLEEVDESEEEEEEGKELKNVGETAWNMRGVSRERGSLLRFMKEEIPGITSPMVYVAMMYSWFAWHVEDHDLDSLNYLHFGAGKTWYGVPRDARLAFEEAVRVHGYGEEVNPLVTFTMLSEKTTVMSPEVLVNAGIPCCRLVQNAGEFVVTFPGAYHSGFSHGFNCAEAANIATPGWLAVAKEAAIRRASTNTPPMISHYQLLYALALSAWPSRVSKSCIIEPRSCRLKDKTKNEGEVMVKEAFAKSVLQNNNLISMLVDRGASCVILPQGFSAGSHCSKTDVSRKMMMKPEALLFMSGNDMQATGDRTPVNMRRLVGSSLSVMNEKEQEIGSGLLDEGLLSCVMCGILSFACVAVVQPRKTAARYIMSNNNCRFFNDQSGSSEESSDIDDMPSWDGIHADFTPVSGQTSRMGEDSTDDPSNSPVQVLNQGSTTPYKSSSGPNSALHLLASTYGASDCESDDEVLNRNLVGCSSGQSWRGEVLTDASVEESNMSSVLHCGKDSSRKHVFCLEHALKVWREFQKIGGADIMLLCHPEYPAIEVEARQVAGDLGIVYHWKDIDFHHATKKDEDSIKSALDDEEAVPTNTDWAVKMGINLYYNASQSKSPLYTKQMPYNAIIYKVFGQEQESRTRQGPGRQKKIIVAGRWCGKVWMTNQVHPFLARVKDAPVLGDEGTDELFFRVPVEQSLGKNSSTPVKKMQLTEIARRSERLKRTPAKLSAFDMSGEAEERKDEEREEKPGTSSSDKCGMVLRSCSSRKKRAVREAPARASVRNKKLKQEDSDWNDVESEQKPEIGVTGRKVKRKDTQLEFKCDLEGCDMSFRNKQDLVLHKKNICPIKGCGKKFFSHKYMLHHRKVHVDDRPLKCPWKGCKMAFKWPWARTEHIRVHTGARPYVCKEPGCDQTFRFVSDFSRHKRKTGHSLKKAKKAKKRAVLTD